MYRKRDNANITGYYHRWHPAGSLPGCGISRRNRTFIHEWICSGLLLFILVHTIFHGEWILNTLQCLRERFSALSLWNLVLDVALFIVFLIVTVSGLMVSRHILFFFGLYAPGYFIWKPIHAIFAEVLLVLVIVHLVVHWRWIIAAVKN